MTSFHTVSIANDMAFPVLDRDQTPNSTHQLGLTKREYFAAMALQGWLAGCANAYSEFTAPGTHTHVAAGGAVKFADALIEALSDEERKDAR